ncbi:ankyrin repeat-containing domain protein [Staphylotrichum tortipilum]|uniref:Ankyrin repeat-containing domain protein n=1 Tax=Staphylotrichum tortipilum TaxID=2831512 RepID=A0AAN6MAY7_9PEZI|nr:ankyrin repeat-containing domain protein [Staphylotrichum longicolle]
MEMVESAPFHGPLSSHRPALADLVKPYLKHGDREYLARLLQIWSPANDEDRANDAMGNALHHAISRGDETAIRMMLDAGVSPTVLQPHDLGYTPLLAASEAGHRGIARLLWQLVGPDGRADPENCTCLELAAWKGHVDMVADFFDLWDGWSTDETREALYAAASDWRDDVVGFLLAKVSYEAGVVQTALERGITGPGMLPGRVFASRQAGAITTAEQDLRLHHVVTQLVDAGASPHGNTRTGVPLLHLTVQSSRLGALKGLLKKGANANVQDKTGKTALHKLFRRTSSSTPSLCTLLQHGASPEIADEAGETALHAAAYTGTLDQLQVCLASCRDDAAVHLCTSHGESLLHYAAAVL